MRQSIHKSYSWADITVNGFPCQENKSLYCPYMYKHANLFINFYESFFLFIGLYGYFIFLIPILLSKFIYCLLHLKLIFDIIKIDTLLILSHFLMDQKTYFICSCFTSTCFFFIYRLS